MRPLNQEDSLGILLTREKRLFVVQRLLMIPSPLSNVLKGCAGSPIFHPPGTGKTAERIESMMIEFAIFETFV